MKIVVGCNGNLHIAKAISTNSVQTPIISKTNFGKLKTRCVIIKIMNDLIKLINSLEDSYIFQPNFD